MKKIRLDVSLVERGFVESRSLSQRLIMAGQVRVDGQLILKPATKVQPGSKVDIDFGPRFVSRGGEKLAAAIDAFNINVEGLTCADIGASTGGFTDCLLQNGADHVYAIDVGHGILDWKLRNDERVTVMEKTNARYVEQLPEQIELATIDVSFISLKKLLPVIRNWFPISHAIPASQNSEQDRMGSVVALIKPQFEAGRSEVKRGKGVIKDPDVHRQVLQDVLTFSQTEGFTVKGLIRSPLFGPKGNIEFLTFLGLAGTKSKIINNFIEEVMPDQSQDD